MNNTDKEYFRLLQLILAQGRVKNNRTGINTVGVFGEQAKFKVDLKAFPILTTKKVWFKGIVHELLWFLSGNTNIKYLVDNDVHIWDEWAYKRYKTALAKHPENTFEVNPSGDLGGNRWRSSWTQEEFIKAIKEDQNFATLWGDLGEGTYGGMWRAFPSHEDPPRFGNPAYQVTVDQIQKVLDKLKTNPDDRRMIVSAWHPYWVDHCALPPCHCLFHFNTEELTLQERIDLAAKELPILMFPPITKDLSAEQWKQQCDLQKIPTRRVNLLLYQRSCDIFLGVPFNITSYALLLAMVAHCSNMLPGVFTHTYGDLHIYENHREQVNTQLSRESLPLPKLWLNPEVRDLFKFKYEDIQLVAYNCHPAIKAPVAV